MVRFAHMADVHLGAFREPRLREANLDAFLRALEQLLARPLQPRKRGRKPKQASEDGHA